MDRRSNVILWMLAICAAWSVSCSSNQARDQFPGIEVTGAMRDVMWEGKLGAVISLDTIKNRNGLYGLGPESYLKGEILILNGRSFHSKPYSNDSMIVAETYDLSAPFFVHGHVSAWSTIEIPDSVQKIPHLEALISEYVLDKDQVYIFRITGNVSTAVIHTQDLPDDTHVSSPDEAHQGQVNYRLSNAESEILGFYSLNHKGIFTHHNSNVHMHLISLDRRFMGHVDTLELNKGAILHIGSN